MSKINYSEVSENHQIYFFLNYRFIGNSHASKWIKKDFVTFSTINDLSLMKHNDNTLYISVVIVT